MGKGVYYAVDLTFYGDGSASKNVKDTVANGAAGGVFVGGFIPFAATASNDPSSGSTIGRGILRVAGAAEYAGRSAAGVVTGKDYTKSQVITKDFVRENSAAVIPVIVAAPTAIAGGIVGGVVGGGVGTAKAAYAAGKAALGYGKKSWYILW